jgi:polysaccharide pyruvyl transferase WcaK-like protein
LNGSTGDKYIQAYYLIAKRLLNKSEKILFLPHKYSKNKKECDREICYKVYNLLLQDEKVDNAKCKIVREDLDVWQAKSLIAESKNAVVSRYHALVAALSTAVPAFSIGWNIKYQDLLNYYGVRSMSVDIRENNPEQIAEYALMKMDEFTSNQILIDKHLENLKKVSRAFELLSSWLLKNTSESI